MISDNPKPKCKCGVAHFGVQILRLSLPEQQRRVPPQVPHWLSQVAGVLPALLCEKILFSCYLVRVSAVHETCTCTCALPETNPRLPATLCVCK